jgi:hypothetical protein
VREIGRRPRRPYRTVPRTGSAGCVCVVDHGLTTPLLNALTGAQAPQHQVCERAAQA